jgi:hypothetical protein
MYPSKGCGRMELDEEKTKNTDKDLKKALSHGDFISISSPISPLSQNFEYDHIPTPTSFSFYQYNPPLGIDFSKALPPIPYLISMELLTFLANIPQVPTELRYLVDILHSLLNQGMISEYKQHLSDSLNEPSKNEKSKQISNSENIQNTKINAMINALGFMLANYLNLLSTHESIQSIQPSRRQIIAEVPSKWLNPKIILDFSNSAELLKTKVKDSKEEIKFNARDAYQLLIFSFFINKIESNLPNSALTTEWNNIKNQLYNQEWKNATKEIANQITLQPSIDDQQVNDAFIHQMFYILQEILR